MSSAGRSVIAAHARTVLSGVALAMLATSAHADDPAASTASTAPTTNAAPIAPAASTTSTTADDDGEPRLSLPTQADRTAWQTSGFRLGLGLVYGRLV
ncbi:MAG TPA: hypothetical protein VIX73_31525, partial [Kofleriaceae bacterium]